MFCFLAASLAFTAFAAARAGGWCARQKGGAQCAEAPTGAKKTDEEILDDAMRELDGDNDDAHVIDAPLPKACVAVKYRRQLPCALAFAASLANGTNSTFGGQKYSVTVSTPPPDPTASGTKVLFYAPNPVDGEASFHGDDDVLTYVATGNPRSRAGRIVQASRKMPENSRLHDVMKTLKSVAEPSAGDSNDHEPAKILVRDLPEPVKTVVTRCGFKMGPKRDAYDACIPWCTHVDAELLMDSLVGPGLGACLRWLRDVEASGGGLEVREDGSTAKEALNKTAAVVCICMDDDEMLSKWRLLMGPFDRYIVKGFTAFVPGATRVVVRWVEVAGGACRGVKIQHHMPDGSVLLGTAIETTSDNEANCRRLALLMDDFDIDGSGPSACAGPAIAVAAPSAN